MISKGLLFAGTGAAALYLVTAVQSYQGIRMAVVFAVKLLFVCGVGLHFVLTPDRSAARRLEPFVAFCERNASAVLVGVIAAATAIAFLTTPQISFGQGALGLGYGHDGVWYGRMTEQFRSYRGFIPADFAYRFLPAMLVHYSGLDTFTRFRILDLTSHALASVLFYRIARDLALPRFAALVAVGFFVIYRTRFLWTPV